MRSPSNRSALYSVMPGEPRDSTGPSFNEAGAIVNMESEDMLADFAATQRAEYNRQKSLEEACLW